MILEIDPEMARLCRVQWTQDLCLSAFDGKFVATPEMLVDMAQYYDLNANDILALILDLEEEGLITGNTDIIMKMVHTLRSDKEMVFEFAIVVESAKVFETYLSIPVKNGNENPQP